MSRLIARHPVLGDLVLHSDPVEPAPTGQAFSFYTLAGADFGDAAPVTNAIDELIGSMVEVDRWSNRQVQFVVTCAAPDGEALSQGEARLGAYFAGRFELVWEPIAAFSKALSFWVEPGTRWVRGSEPQGLDWDLAEKLGSRRSWQVTLTTRPFVVAATPAVTEWALSGNQGAQQVTIGGVAPANAGLTVSGSSGLGKVVAHVASTPLPYSPALRSRMTTSTATLTRTGVPSFAGTTWRAWTSSGFTIPASALPDGPYELLAHVHSETAQTIALPWTAQSKVGATSIGPSWGGSSDPVAFTTTTDQLVPLGKLALPIIASEDPAAALFISLGLAANVYLDEVWLLWVPDEDAALITGDLGTGAPAVGSAYSRLEVQSPSVLEPRQRLRVGVGATATVGGSHVISADRLVVKPGPVQVYAGSTGAAGAEVSLSAWEAFHDHTAGAAA